MKHEEPTEPKLSRAEIETLCLLDAVGTTASMPIQIAERLGLCMSQGPAIIDALATLVSGGLLAEANEHYRRTNQGTVKLTRIVARLNLTQA